MPVHSSRIPAVLIKGLEGVGTRTELRALGLSHHQIDAQLAARRWRLVGLAVVLHNGPVTRAQRCRIYLINCGPRSILTSFTAAEDYGLKNWERPDIHVLAPAGTRRPLLPHLRLHRVGDWSSVQWLRPRRLHALAPALILAAASFATPRGGIGLLASAVQQRLVSADALRTALDQAPRTRHRKALSLAVADLGQGSDALSEIDFVRLCRRFRLPKPTQQAVRIVGGRRRYLDVEWQLPDGRRVAVEVDGAHHMAAGQWERDQLRQNQIVLDGTVVLRFPATVVRDQPELVAAQLRQILMPRSG